MLSVLLVYLGAILLGAAGLLGLFYFLKAIKKSKIRWGMTFVGLLVSVIYYSLELLLFRTTFGTMDYYNTAAFKLVVGFLFLMFFCLARILIVRVVFFGRQKSDSGLSFCMGFGSAWALLFTVYLLVYTLVIVYYGLFVGLSITDVEGRLIFNDSTAIAVFRPLLGHLSFGVFFVSISVLCMSTGCLLAKIARKMIRPVFAVIWIILLMILESFSIQLVLYINAIPHWAVALNSVVAASLSVVLVRFIPVRKEEAEYTKQFE